AGAAPAREGDLADAVVDRLEQFGDPELTIPPHVINATGVVLHTNLGRAPWPRAARVAAVAAARSYGYLELDEATGRRGPRFRAVEDHLVALTGADADRTPRGRRRSGSVQRGQARRRSAGGADCRPLRPRGAPAP